MHNIKASFDAPTRSTLVTSQGKYGAILLLAICMFGCRTQFDEHGNNQHRSEKVAPCQLRHDRTNEYRALLQAFAAVRPGQSDGRISAVLTNVLTRVESGPYIQRFSALVPYTNSLLMTAWKSDWVEPDGWPQIVFLVYEDATKSSLVDAIWYDQGNVRPIVDGLFNKRLLAVTKGDSIESVYKHLGRRSCEFSAGFGGKWFVMLTYVGYQGRIFVIEVDAATGIITQVNDGTL